METAPVPGVALHIFLIFDSKVEAPWYLEFDVLLGGAISDLGLFRLPLN